MRRVRAFARLVYRRSGARCLRNGHRPMRTVLGGHVCATCRMVAGDLSDFGLLDGGDYINPLRTRFDRRHGGSITRSVDPHEEPVRGWRAS